MIVVVAGGEWRPAELAAAGAFLAAATKPVGETAARTVICADSGLDSARALGLAPTHLIGDLDSVSAAGRRWADAHDVTVTTAPTAKDETDLELAMAVAVELGTTEELYVVDGGGGRLDHALANVAVLASPRWRAQPVRAVFGAAHVVVLRGPESCRVPGAPGSVVSLVPVGGDAVGVATRGLRWELDHEVLLATEARGVSNELVDRGAEVAVTAGALAVIQALSEWS
jgi:thiamine pyrophosphokinase